VKEMLDGTAAEVGTLRKRKVGRNPHPFPREIAVVSPSSGIGAMPMSRGFGREEAKAAIFDRLCLP
jgi:hypothetical protein